MLSLNLGGLVRAPVVTPMKRQSSEARRWYQLPQQPEYVPAPQPQPPQYGAATQTDKHRPLSTILKENPGKAGVMLIGAILLIIPTTRAAIVGAVAFLAVSHSATAASTSNKKEKK